MAQFKARWANDQERSSDHQHNGVVEGVDVGRYGERVKFYVSPMALAERVASALNVTEKFSDDELKRMAAAIAPV